MSSHVPALIDHLVAVLTPAMPTDAVVIDGAGLSEQTPQQRVHVGLPSIFEDGPYTAAEVRQEHATMGGGLKQTITVHNVAVAWDGGSAMKTARDAAYALMDAVAAALAADLTLGGLATSATVLVSASYEHAATAEGLIVQIPFDVEFVVQPA